ncbi:hypothetical protein INT43_007589 [Umbelopsis isabellina]|uniref:Uncharacterized protein n=1 Tax=Mortierella isabellina TaxID=91625 RepID=A0A8H7PND4_MORIS|nr:hypothetical protein INT43_007589 [Umbelopsis isabellina]
MPGNFVPIRVPGSLAFMLIISLNSTLYTLVLCFDNRLAHPAWYPSTFLVCTATLYAVALFVSALLPELPIVQGSTTLSCTWTDYGSWREMFVPSVYSWSAAVDGACTQLIAAVALSWILCMTYPVLIFLYWRQRSSARIHLGQVVHDQKRHEKTVSHTFW